MRRRGVLPDKFTFTFLLTSFNSVDDLVNGKSIHASSVVLGYQSNPYMQTELVSMYLACGSLEYSWRLFNELPSRDVVSWTAMISGLAAHGFVEQSLSVFNEMRRDDSIVKPNTATMISAISACASWGSLNHTKNLHAYSLKAGLDSHVFSKNSLIDAYGKCGSIGCAQQVFDEMHYKDLHSWTSMIMGLAVNGLGQHAILLFSDMQRTGLMPDSASFVAILAACSHSGLLDEGTQIFESMKAVFGVKPDQKHYGCMVDLFCRAGHLSRAYEFISSMKMEPNLEILGAFLSASSAHENLGLGELLCMRTESLVPLYRRGASVLLSNMYANSGQWHKVISIRKMRREEGEKPPAKSWIEIRGIVEEFVAGHKLHPFFVEIEWILNGLDKVMEGVM
ncbi:hypothetical protein HPP92_014450 [Vanilla planifolia]|uniref:Pentatricopeptide repeat-containing protein n=1 Tax=Vanilla planifolia TaxID=51239 RepID=A0A835QQ26_VANPL|nr:hypothetical protein HPP92_014450 [Vanilla planifolia]